MKTAGPTDGRSSATSAADFLPEKRSLRSLTEAAEHCRGCELYRRATQTVFGKGPANAGLMLVGEVPGDREDQVGEPFVGPAGRLLDEALEAAAIPRREIYLTNAVKHFKWEPRGKRRLHARPSAREISACRPWLDAEIEVVGPKVIVCLGAIAAQALLGRAFRITRQRGRAVASPLAESVLATWHPSAVLRSPDEADRARMRSELFEDVQKAVMLLSEKTHV